MQCRVVIRDNSCGIIDLVGAKTVSACCFRLLECVPELCAIADKLCRARSLEMIIHGMAKVCELLPEGTLRNTVDCSIRCYAYREAQSASVFPQQVGTCQGLGRFTFGTYTYRP